MHVAVPEQTSRSAIDRPSEPRRRFLMLPRDIMRLYQTAARVWLTAAGLSLLLSPTARLGWWVPLHLMLLGAVSVAIGGAMQNFVAALTATGAAAPAIVWAQFALTNVGAAIVVAGRASGSTPLVAAGGATFLGGILVLGFIVWHGWRRALHLRHRVPVVMYGAAVASVAGGAAIGIVLGTGAVHGAAAYLGLRGAHMVLNVLGWVSLTIAGTLITLLPTLLRVRMPPWRGHLTVAAFLIAIGTTAAGLALNASSVAVVGGVCFLVAVGGLLTMVGRVLTTPRRWSVPLSARHLLLALVWLAAGAVWLPVALVHGLPWFAGADGTFVLVFAGGWILQTLLGAWLYLLPMARPGHPDERRAALAAVEWGGVVQLVALNVGLALIGIAGARPDASVLATVGAGSALVGAGMALVKAWSYPILGRSAFLVRGSRSLWDPAGGRP